MAAEAIFHAALRPRRELWVGWPAVKAIIGTRIVPGFIDRLLARRGYEGQHTDEPLPPGRRDNLYAPVPGDHGAHGRFDARSRNHSVQLWATMHRGALATGAVALGLAALLGWTSRRRLR